ncbi:MAG: hypothetical protein AAF623_05090 [Planctomycetota bacterium]
MLIAIGILTFILIVASTWWFGLWSNLITLINLLISSMLASSIFEPISTELENINRSYRLLYDFIAVWLVFIVSFIVIRAITDSLSGYRLKFDNVTELIGRSILSVWIAGVFICFSFFTLQMAPLPPDTYGNSQTVDQGTIPDRLWLAFIQSRSRGALSSSKAAGIWPEYKLPDHPDDVGKDMRVFDPYARFLRFNATRRQTISKMKRLRVN